MSSTLLDLGFFEIKWYSALILLAFIIGYGLVISRCKKKGLNSSKISDMCFYLVMVCILGARLYYCIFNFKDYTNIIDIFKIWEGGLAIHGGIIAGIIFIYFYTRKHDISLLDVLDVFAPALVLGQAIGRWGNFFNQEAFGPLLDKVNPTNPAFLQSLHIPEFIINGMYIDDPFKVAIPGYYHPTFLYESLGCLLIFIIIMIIRNIKTIKPGQVASIYFIGYGILRFLIESLRQDSLMFFNLKAAQLVSIIMILVGIVLFILPYIKRLKESS